MIGLFHVADLVGQIVFSQVAVTKCKHFVTATFYKEFTDGKGFTVVIPPAFMV